ncbi:MAG: exosortase-associated EpsI family protein [Verrucomicrobia bacterium]|nr:exosortase-associated EpsI family protein [Verrucomicrobiota bacterium]
MIGTGIFSALILLCWSFPDFWYTQSGRAQDFVWFSENDRLNGWTFRSVPVAESAEKILVADRLINGEFFNEKKEIVRVFSAKRYQENQNEIGLFVHTPDRCWTESGWQIEPAVPDVVALSIHGVPLQIERRIFVYEGHRELVYFCGLVGGQPLPYRLDHNLSVGLKHQLRTAIDKTGTTLRAADSRLWRRVWDSFVSRQPFLGPKQFLRVSSSLAAGSDAEADRRLQEFLPRWLQPADYEQERRAWLAKQL